MAKITEEIKSAEDAYQRVEAARAELRAEYDQVCAEIDKLQAELDELPLAVLPFDDLKASITEFIRSSGMRYAEQYLKTAVTNFATGGAKGMSPGPLNGRPLRFCDVEKIVSGEYSAYSRAQLCHPEKQRKRPVSAVWAKAGSRVKIARRRASWNCAHEGDHGHKFENG